MLLLLMLVNSTFDSSSLLTPNPKKLRLDDFGEVRRGDFGEVRLDDFGEVRRGGGDLLSEVGGPFTGNLAGKRA